MPSVTLTILGDATGARRALAETRAEYERASTALGGMGRRSAADRRRDEAEEIAGARRQLRVLHDARVRARLARKREDDAAAAQRKRDRRKDESEQVADARRTFQALQRDRQKARQERRREEAQEEARRKQDRKRSEAEEIADARRHFQQMQRTRTRLAEQQARARARTERGRTSFYRGAGEVVRQVGGAAIGVASDVHGQIQDARTRRAHANRVLGDAARGAGMSETEERALRTRLLRFQSQTGITYEEAAQALKLGQERGQALEGASPQARTQALEAALSSMREANATGTDMGQFLTARGRLGAAGLQGEHLQRTMRFVLGAAREGNVEVDQIIQQGLPGATQLMRQRESALGPDATDEQRMAARAAAFRESVALQEVAARSGRQPGNTANVLSSLQNFLSTPRRQEMMLNNIRSAERRVNTHTPEGRAQAQRYQALRAELFERDPTRRGDAMRMRAEFVNNPLMVAERLASATGGNANAAANLFAGGGRGNPQALLANQRQLFSFLGSEGGSVRRMMDASVSDNQMRDFRRRTEGDDLSNLNRDAGARDQALLDNTGALRQLSDRLASWSAQNPIGSSVLGAGGGMLGGLLSGGRIGGAMQWLRGGGVSSLLTRGGTAARAGLAMLNGGSIATAINSAGAATGAAGIGANVAGIGLSAVGGLGLGYGINRAMGHDEAEANPFRREFYTEFAGAVRDALRDLQVTATVDPHTAAHAASQAAGGRSAR